MRISTQGNFNFWRTVYSHGWCALPPFMVRRETRTLVRLLEVSMGGIVEASITQNSPPALQVGLKANGGVLASGQKSDLRTQLRIVFRLDEDFSEFYRAARGLRNFRWVARAGAGRLLRAPTAFEDVVKMICTTNCSWALTETMVGNLCQKLGKPFVLPGEPERFTFPGPEAIASTTEAFLRKEIRVGYRAPYLLEFARRTASAEIAPESWRSSDLPTEELFRKVRSVKGVGEYAAGNILKLLGRYDYLGIDSWCRKRFSQMYRKGRAVSDRSIRKFYEQFGRWRGLFFWMDVTHHWYGKKFPF